MHINRPEFLSLRTVVFIFGSDLSLLWGISCTLKMFNGILGIYPLGFSSNPQSRAKLHQPKMSSDIVKCPMGMVENHRFKQNGLTLLRVFASLSSQSQMKILTTYVISFCGHFWFRSQAYFWRGQNSCSYWVLLGAIIIHLRAWHPFIIASSSGPTCMG